MHTHTLVSVAGHAASALAHNEVLDPQPLLLSEESEFLDQLQVLRLGLPTSVTPLPLLHSEGEGERGVIQHSGKKSPGSTIAHE